MSGIDDKYYISHQQWCTIKFNNQLPNDTTCRIHYYCRLWFCGIDLRNQFCFLNDFMNDILNPLFYEVLVD